VLILGLDPWLLNKNNDQKRWRSLSAEYNEIAGLITSDAKYSQSGNISFQKYLELLSPSYFQASLSACIRNLLSKEKKQGEYFPIAGRDSKFGVKLSDGSLIYDEKMRTISPEGASREAISYTHEIPVYSLGNFNTLDAGYIKTLKKFIDLITKDNVRIVFYLPPYHPIVYKNLSVSGQYKTILKAQQYFMTLAKDKGIKVFGSYDPDDCFLKEADFYDGMHAKREALPRIFKEAALSTQ
jgi:hypothetical protein